jgi:hypothetical protein
MQSKSQSIATGKQRVKCTNEKHPTSVQLAGRLFGSAICLLLSWRSTFAEGSAKTACETKNKSNVSSLKKQRKRVNATHGKNSDSSDEGGERHSSGKGSGVSDSFNFILKLKQKPKRYRTASQTAPYIPLEESSDYLRLENGLCLSPHPNQSNAVFSNPRPES